MCVSIKNIYRHVENYVNSSFYSSSAKYILGNLGFEPVVMTSSPPTRFMFVFSHYPSALLLNIYHFCSTTTFPKCTNQGTIMVVRQLPPNESSRSRVSFESRYGTWDRARRSVNAEITLPWGCWGSKNRLQAVECLVFLMKKTQEPYLNYHNQ